MASPIGLVLDSVKGTDGSVVGSKTNIGKYQVYKTGTINKQNAGEKVKSLFGRSVFTPFPEIVDRDTGDAVTMMRIKDVHGDTTYNTSVQSLIEYSQQKGKRAMYLRQADFAYLKNLGVYPNNRLIIARRFGGGVGSNLMKVGSMPHATLISWFDDKDLDFFNLSFGEEWDEADADFTNILNEIGETLKMSSDEGNPLGSVLARGFDLLPFGGFSEPLQRVVMSKLGFVNDPYNLPAGNPNLVREAKKRKTLGKGEAGAGLKCDLNIKMKVEYEQKFISGVDPTIAYLDIIQNAITFGTSDAAFQMSGGFGGAAGKLLSNLVNGNFGAIFKAMKNIVFSIFNAIGSFITKVIDALTNPQNLDPAAIGGFIVKIFTGALDFVGKSFSAIIGKFKVRLRGIINALTGAPSCPWHVTIGNPKRPFFSSGDLLLDSIAVNFGPTLAFNDLPAYVSFDLTFKNARALGASEIFSRMNTGRGRSYIKAVFKGNPNDAQITDIEEGKEIVTDSFETYPTSQDPTDSTGKGLSHSDARYSQLEGEGFAKYEWYKFGEASKEKEQDPYTEADIPDATLIDKIPNDPGAGSAAASTSGAAAASKSKAKK